jgi:hypothetical protein
VSVGASVVVLFIMMQLLWSCRLVIYSVSVSLLLQRILSMSVLRHSLQTFSFSPSLGISGVFLTLDLSDF